jgi:hypothetical protein
MSVRFHPRKYASKGVLRYHQKLVIPDHVIALMDVCKKTNRACDISFQKGKMPTVSIRSIRE